MEHISICSSPAYGDTSLADHAVEIRERLNSALRIVDQVANMPASRLPDQRVTEKDIRSMLKLRRNRDRHFGGELFADPAWDILLELYAAELGQQKISVGSLCMGAAVPATTALRWISLLEKKGLIERRADPMDGRRFHVFLSGAGLDALTNYFETVPDGTRFI